jgi:hypothetical protein
MQRERRRHPQRVHQKARLIHGPGERDRARGIVERDVEMMGGQVGDPTVERVQEAAGGVEIGGPVAHQAAAGHQFVEAVEPADARRLGEGHEPGMHRPVHRRLPAEFELAGHDLPDAEPPVGQHEHLRRSRHEFHEQHAFASAPGQPPRPHGQRTDRDIDLVGGEV